MRLPDGDLLIHAGDFSMNGNPIQVLNFLAWFEEVCSKFTYGGILIAGNHDLTLDPNRCSKENFVLISHLVRQGKHFKYLENSHVILPNGITVWGSPYTPWFLGHIWAFSQTEDKLQLNWWGIPQEVDILVTHGPVWGILDQIIPGSGEHLGSPSLRNLIDRVFHDMKLHVGGHIHGGYGIHQDPRDSSGRIFVIPSFVDERYHPVNDPISVEIKERTNGFIQRI